MSDMSEKRVRVLMQPLPDADGTPANCEPVELTGIAFVGMMVGNDGIPIYVATYCTRQDLVKSTATLLSVVQRALGPEGLLEVILSVPRSRVDAVIEI